MLSRKFDRASSSYSSEADVQRRVAEQLLLRLETVDAETKFASDSLDSVLELGSGTGLLSEMLVQHFSPSRYLCLDFSDGMSEELRRKGLPGLRVEKHNLESFGLEEQFRLVCSSSTLHWVENLQGLFAKLADCLSEKGLFAFSIMLSGTWREIFDACREVSSEFVPALDYRTFEEVENLVTEAGFSLIQADSASFKEQFQTPRGLIQSLRKRGVQGSPKRSSILSQSQLREAIGTLGNNDSLIELSYAVGFFVCSR